MQKYIENRRKKEGYHPLHTSQGSQTGAEEFCHLSVDVCARKTLAGMLCARWVGWPGGCTVQVLKFRGIGQLGKIHILVMLGMPKDRVRTRG